MPHGWDARALAERAAVARVQDAVRDALAGQSALVLAVSGGRDSVVLLDAALAVARERVLAVATFDHGSGEPAVLAAAHVRALARQAGVPVRVGRPRRPLRPTEAAWRAARWRFLRRVARAAAPDGPPAVVATGHTADDQLETVVMRLLRGAGVRGLAAMYAPRRGIVRPLLGVSSAAVAAYAAARRLAWVEDPTNADLRFLRNRVRHELLPALHRLRPTLGAELLAAGVAAAGCRAELEALAARLRAAAAVAGDDLAGGAVVARLADLRGATAGALAALWPALAGGAGVRLDRGGTERLAAFTIASVASVERGNVRGRGLSIAGGTQVSVERRGAAGRAEWCLVVRRRRRSPSPAAAGPAGVLVPERAGTAVRIGGWRLRVLARAPRAAELEGGCVAWLAADRRYVVRGWRPGDRWRAPGTAAARRVKRFLADRHVPAAARAGWPVIVVEAGAVGGAGGAPPAAPDGSGGQIVWVPGVRRSSAAPARPGQPGYYLLCERTPERRHGRP